MHQLTVKVSCHPHTCAGSATRERLGKHAWLRERTTAKKEGGSTVRGTQESDRTSSPTPAEIKVCSRAVLTGSGCAKHQAIGPLPQPRNRSEVGYDIVASSPGSNPLNWSTCDQDNILFRRAFFNTHTRSHHLFRLAHHRACHL